MEDDRPPLAIRMLGPLAVSRDGADTALPSSRKVRALLGYLALSGRAVGRGRLCGLLWDVPNDPRGELRWCLSKLRALLDEPDHARVETVDDSVGLRLDNCEVDVRELISTAGQDVDKLPVDDLRRLLSRFDGEFLEGLDVDRSPEFTQWLMAQRRRFHSLRVALLDRLVSQLGEDSAASIPWLEQWLQLLPLDIRGQGFLLTALVRQGRLDEGETHLHTAARLFDAEGVDFTPVRRIWQELRGQRQQQPFASPILRELDARPDAPSDRKRASLAVMPFGDGRAVSAFRGGLADGLTHDIISRLARLRDFFVIARGSVFALAEKGVDAREAGGRLNVDYVASGEIRRVGDRVVVDVDLVDVATARIIWSDSFETRSEDLFAILEGIGNAIVSSISAEIEIAERNRAMLKPPASLNAWEAYHRGLWHMYRFTRAENETARHFFAAATQLDPTFARALAGLSFTHWQSAFQGWGDREGDTAAAYDTACSSVLLDDHNPTAHWAMGRALWLRGASSESVDELTHAVELSPNFALGHYALSFVQSQSGDPLAAIGSADHSRHLSPYDPLLFGMLGARAMAHVRLGEFEEAAEWALKAAARPNSHVIILAIAANCLGLASRVEEGRAMAARIHSQVPGYDADAFLASFRFEPEAARLFRKGAAGIGLG